MQEVQAQAPVTGSAGPNDAAAAAAAASVRITADNKVIQEGAAAPAAAPPAATGSKRPDYIPEKFWDAKTGTVNTEALAKSYAELEGKQSGKPAVETPAVETPAAALTPIQKLQQQGTADIQKDGKLSDATYAEALKQGFDKATVDAYIAGVRGQEQAYNKAIADAANGPETYNKMLQWAGANASEADIKAYNAAVTSGDTAKATEAVKAMSAKYTAAVGREPVRKVEGDNSPVAVDIYTPEAYRADMANPLYKKSEDFRSKVIAKLQRTVAAGKSVF